MKEMKEMKIKRIEGPYTLKEMKKIKEMKELWGPTLSKKWKYGNPEWAAWFLGKPSFNLDPAPAKRSSRWDPEYFLAGATSDEHPS